jgi:hypothetical protein
MIGDMFYMPTVPSLDSVYDKIKGQDWPAIAPTDQISFDEMISGHMVSHWIVVLYFYGWAHHVMNYLRKISSFFYVATIKG